MVHPQPPNPQNPHYPPGAWQPGPSPQQVGPYGGAPQQYPKYGMQPPGPGPQPYPPQGGYPPQRSGGGGSKVLFAVLGVVVVLVVAAGVGIFLLVSDNGTGGTDQDDPRAVAQAFVNSNGNQEDLLCKADLDKIKDAQESLGPQPTGIPDMDMSAKSTLKSVNVPEGSNSGTFTVAISMNIAGESLNQTVTYDLVKEDGEWKVCGLLDLP
ncbi:Rv0361 family membrane protein [Nocardia paucivorans]|uniref:Rv0361 family membrane protein n=1 Tax=Nocardia paucivorans TaxID=114259 RepID=UPI0012FC20D8|nr:hypothetical protein [Nocardia paucivorans]